ncbi:MAG: hypothetical protein H6R10_2123 [Rhodocyclaceae bacterium]|nr:hypothetical protein [Rhodocyclaceae bacterium]
MRPFLLIAVPLSVLLAACASPSNAPTIRAIDQSSSLKVHPGLLGKTVPAESQPQAAAADKSGN